MTPVEGWPAGFYRTGPPLGVWVVVLPELPPGRETLPLRLFGDDEQRYQVAQELKRMPADDAVRQGVGPRLYRWSVWLRGEPENEQKARLAMDLEQMVQQDMDRLRGEGEKKGRLDGERQGRLEGEARGLRTAVLDLCEVLTVELTAERRAHVASLDLPALEALRLALKQTRRWPG
jgi:hypothetical protein